MSEAQTTIEAFAPSTDQIDITRTVRLKLETSQAKNEIVRLGIDAYQQVAENMATVLPSYPEWEWEPRHSHMYHHAKRFLPDLPDDVDGRGFKTTVAQEAQKQVAESFKSWRERGKPGDLPMGEFGDGDFMQLRSDDVEIVANERGWGLKANFISYGDPVWFHIDAGQFQAEFLERITDSDDDATAGSAELHLHDDGSLYAHQTVTWSVDTWQADDVSTVVGVDLNDDPLVAAAVVAGDEVEDVLLESGSEFRHHRERVKHKRSQAMERDDLKAIKDARLKYQQYTDHITNVASRRVVDLAVEHAPCRIQLEDLTHLRETVESPIHDWPYAQIQDQIVSKAQEEGVPVTIVDPRDTSTTCRQCGATNPAMRDGRDFECWECGYEVHADVNAAINIAQQ